MLPVAEFPDLIVSAPQRPIYKHLVWELGLLQLEELLLLYAVHVIDLLLYLIPSLPAARQFLLALLIRGKEFSVPGLPGLMKAA